jgi:elongator complex protein 2
LAAVDLSAELDVESEAVEGEVIVESNEDETESEARLMFSAGGVQYAVLLESLLVGHEDWVTSVHWMPAAVGSSPEDAIEYRLFSTSMDRNMVIWSPDASAGGVWVPKVRMGDIGGALGGMIGGNLLGFVGGATSPQGFALIGVGYGGSFHLWEQQQGGEEAGRWTPVPLSSGHFASVNDLCWSDDARGDYLTTVSADQTCRIFAPLQRTAGGSPVWKEISRPQIHGYDLNCVVQAPQRGVHTLYTAGEEKLIRVFDAPNSVLRGLEKLCGIPMSNSAGASR